MPGPNVINREEVTFRATGQVPRPSTSGSSTKFPGEVVGEAAASGLSTAVKLALVVAALAFVAWELKK